MQFPDPLVRATLIRRYKRFLADMCLPDGREVTVHCANPGSMLGLDQPGLTCWLSPSRTPARKLAWSWELLELPSGALVGINTAHPNQLIFEAVSAGQLAPLRGYSVLRREVKYGMNSRIDLLLESPDRPPCYVEVKNVHLSRQPGLAEFPDCVTARGAKHLVELGDMVRKGARAVMVFLVQRDDCTSFSLADDLDPGYAKAFATARQAGVEVLCYGCELSPTAIGVAGPLPLAT